MYCHQLILKKEAERSYETWLNLHKAARRHLLPRYLSGPVLSYMKHIACPLTRPRVHSVDSRPPASKGCVSLLEKMHVYSLLVPWQYIQSICWFFRVRTVQVSSTCVLVISFHILKAKRTREYL